MLIIFSSLPGPRRKGWLGLGGHRSLTEPWFDLAFQYSWTQDVLVYCLRPSSPYSLLFIPTILHPSPPMLGFLSGLTDMLSSWGAARSCPSYCNCPHQLSVSQPLVHLINTLLSPPPPAFPHLYASQRDSLYSNSTCLNIHEFLRKAACSVRLQEKTQPTCAGSW